MSTHDHDEILRLRDRMHLVLNELAAFRLRLQSLEEWRAEARTQIAGVGKRCDELAAQIEDVLKSDEIADAVATKMKQTNTLHLSYMQRFGAFIAFVLTCAASVKVLLG